MSPSGSVRLLCGTCVAMPCASAYLMWSSVRGTSVVEFLDFLVASIHLSSRVNHFAGWRCGVPRAGTSRQGPFSAAETDGIMATIYAARGLTPLMYVPLSSYGMSAPLVDDGLDGSSSSCFFYGLFVPCICRLGLSHPGLFCSIN